MASTYKHRDFDEDLMNVLDFCQEKKLYYQSSGRRVYAAKNLLLNPLSKYFIKRSFTDGDEITYYVMERFVDEDDCDDCKEIFSISLDVYDLGTDLINLLEKGCAKNNI